MKTVLRNSWIVMALLAGLMINASAETAEGMAAEEGVVTEQAVVKEGKKGEARFAVGLTYSSGIMDVEDYIVDSYAANGYDVDYLVIPLGVSFVGGYRFGFGLELLGDVGPASFIAVDDLSVDDVFVNYDIPIGFTVGYAFLTDKSVSPYFRGGFRYHISGGDYTESSEAGLYVAGGINFFSNKAVQLQVEVAYDGSIVTYKTPDDSLIAYPDEEIEPGGLMISIRAAF